MELSSGEIDKTKLVVKGLKYSLCLSIMAPYHFPCNNDRSKEFNVYSNDNIRVIFILMISFIIFFN